ncbi:probable serine/threonine-protein kinase At1g01540 [Vigna unguiculata]|uniref:non-specific serine/threonine protein kinase n=1 Tax=Vigna unguiculata TaxID=3917 RepID=A0A4D6LS83_VIGUN|nr:probable serine/threonine-protein kinase At1g01540 [Vigna unguiculata]QCD91340.1 serine/threonine-protein kinase PBS1 [Vigna unguiculata]
MPDSGAMNDQLSNPTSIFGLRLWVVLGVCVGAAIVLILFLISVWVAFKRSKANPVSIPDVSKEIQEIRVDHAPTPNPTHQPDPFPEPDPLPPTDEESNPLGYHRIQFEIGKNHRISYPERALLRSSSNDPAGAEPRLLDQVPTVIPEVSHLGWGHWYTLRELEDSTNAFAPENVIGEGGYGIVYHGILNDNTHVAIKNLLNNRGQAEKEFKVEVEAIGRVRHKNLVRLLGYCAEGAHRMLVYEYVDNGNLEQWLHGDVGPYSPLTWEIRMNIILGTAKGLTYLHEGLEPKVVHRDIKSSNILLSKQWNAKVSDFGLAKLLGSDNSYITTRVMGTFGYVAPEYASTGMLNERSDVYSFGILIMEVLTGRNPVDYSRPPEEVNLVDWLKKMVSNRNPEGVLDPKLPEKPTSRALKRALLVALRCTDPNAQKRPKMGHVIHMLEAEDSPYKEDRRARRDAGQSPNDRVGDGLKEEAGVSVDDGKVENGMVVNETRTSPQIEKQ